MGKDLLRKGTAPALEKHLDLVTKYLLVDDKSSVVSIRQITKKDKLNWEFVLFLSNDRLLIRGKHIVHVQLSQYHPFEAPKLVKFITPIYHPNVNEKGEIDLPLLNALGWSPEMRVDTVLLSICGIINQPIKINTYLEEKSNSFDYNNECVVAYAKNQNKSYDSMDIFHAVNDLFDDGFGSHYANEMQQVVFEYIGFSIDGDLSSYIDELTMQRCLQEQSKRTMRKKIDLHCESFGNLQMRTVTVWSNATIKDVKKELCKDLGVPFHDFMLLFEGRLLNDKSTLFECDITDGALLWISSTYNATIDSFRKMAKQYRKNVQDLMAKKV